jgi:hypothetical protein
MIIKETKTEQNQTLANVPLGLWARFKAKCAMKRIKEPGFTMTQGFIEAANDWLAKD